MGQEQEAKDLDISQWDRFVDFIQSPFFRTIITEASKNAIEHTLVRLGFRMSDGANEIQEDMLFLRRLRQGDPLRRLERMEVQMAEHEKRDEERQVEILQKLADAKQDRELTHRRVSELKAGVNQDMQILRNAMNTKIDEVVGKDGPLDSLRKDNRSALLAILGTALTVIGILLYKYVLP